MPRRLPRPTEAYILALKAEQEGRPELIAQRDLLRRVRELRALERAVNVPQRLVDLVGGQGLEFRNPAIADELSALPAMFTANEPNLVVNLGRDTKQAVENTTLRERFTKTALLEEIGCREPGPSTFERVVDATFEGGGWSKLLRNRDVWEDRYALKEGDFDSLDAYDEAVEDAKKKAGVPLEWVSVDAMGLLPVYEGTRLVEVLEVQRRSLLTTFAQYDLGLDAAGHPCPRALAVVGWERDAGSQTVEFVIHVNAQWITHLIARNGAAIVPTGARGKAMQWRHGYGFVPYFSSLGLTKNHERGRVVTWSISETKRYLVEYHSYLRTVFAYLAMRDAMPPLYEAAPDPATALTGDDQTPATPSVYELGVTYHGQPGQTLTAVAFPDNADKIQLEIAQADKDIQALSPPKMTGSMGDLGGAGFAISTVLSEYKMRYAQLRAGIERHLREVTLRLWDLIAQIDEPVYLFGRGQDVGWLKAEAATFAAPADVRWELVPETPSAKIIEERYWASRVQNGSASRRMMIEALGSNVDEVRRGRALDRIEETPWFLQAEEAEVLAQMGRGEWAKMNQQSDQMVALQQQMAAQGGQAGAGPFGQGGTPGPGSDAGNLALSPNGAGAQPGTELQMTLPPGNPQGMPSSPGVPTRGATAQVARL